MDTEQKDINLYYSLPTTRNADGEEDRDETWGSRRGNCPTELSLLKQMRTVNGVSVIGDQPWLWPTRGQRGAHEGPNAGAGDEIRRGLPLTAAFSIKTAELWRLLFEERRTRANEFLEQIWQKTDATVWPLRESKEPSAWTQDGGFSSTQDGWSTIEQPHRIEQTNRIATNFVWEF